MRQDEILLEYATTCDWRDPDAPSVAVTVELLDNAVEHYIENMTAEECLSELSDYIWEDMVMRCERNDRFGRVQDIVDRYLKDTQ